MKAFFPYAATTEGITVRVAPRFLDDESDVSAGQYAWSYHVRIENHGLHEVQLIARHWIITDDSGRVEDVRGKGVIGEQPTIPTGGSFDYISGCPLPTPSGTMGGSFTMATQAALFDIVIPLFSLDIPGSKRVLN